MESYDLQMEKHGAVVNLSMNALTPHPGRTQRATSKALKASLASVNVSVHDSTGRHRQKINVFVG